MFCKDYAKSLNALGGVRSDDDAAAPFQIWDDVQTPRRLPVRRPCGEGALGVELAGEALAVLRPRRA